MDRYHRGQVQVDFPHSQDGEFVQQHEPHSQDFFETAEWEYQPAPPADRAMTTGRIIA
jgi:hypothetical protein